MLELQTDLIEFDLLNSVYNKNFSSDSIDRDKPSLIMFICNHCPYVIHYHDEIVRLEADYAESINIIAISSNDIISHPQDNPHKMKEMWNSLDLSFPYLFDETSRNSKKI
jgi:Thiol-disulfide isomerase and thioredoxins